MSDPKRERRRTTRMPPDSGPDELRRKKKDLRALYQQGQHDDGALLRFCQELHSLQPRYHAIGAASLHDLWHQITGEAHYSDDARQKLANLGGKSVDPTEAIGSALGRTRLRLIAGLPEAERLVFFAYGRQRAAALRAREPDDFLGERPLQQVIREADGYGGEARLAFLRARLGVTKAECRKPTPSSRPIRNVRGKAQDDPVIELARFNDSTLKPLFDDLLARAQAGATLDPVDLAVLQQHLGPARRLDELVTALRSRKPAADAQAEQELAPPRPARRPYLIGDLDYAIPVGYPFNQPSHDVDEFERRTAEIITASSGLCRALDELYQGRRLPGHAIHVLLQLRTSRAARRFLTAAQEAQALIEGGAAQGLADLHALDVSAAAEERRPHMPLFTDFSQGLPADFYPLSWVPISVRDLLNDPAPERMEPVCWRVLGLYEALHQRMAPWLIQRRHGGTADTRLLCQLQEVLKDAFQASVRIFGEFMEGAEEGVQIEEEEGTQAARLEVPVSARPAEPNLVILGSDWNVPLYTKIGHDARGRQVALSLFEPLLVLALGGWGWGKSYLGRLIAESLHLSLPGINRLHHGLRSATFEVNYRLGRGRRQMLRGFYPNSNAQQLQYLHDHFSTTLSNAAFRRGLLRCLPSSLERLRRELAPYVERGLVIEAIELGACNLGQFGYECLLGAAFRKRTDRPVYADLLASLIGVYGDALTPALLMAEVETMAGFGRVREALLAQLRPLLSMVRPGADVRRDLEEGCPLFYLLEQEHEPESFLLGLLVTLMRALGTPVGEPDQDQMLWLFCDELTKIVELPLVAELLNEMGQEIRHRRVSLFLGGQRGTNLPRGFLGQVSALFEFHMTTQTEHDSLRGLQWMQEVGYAMNRQLDRGHALAGAVLATDPSFRELAQHVRLRPTLIDAGGETVTAR